MAKESTTMTPTTPMAHPRIAVTGNLSLIRLVTETACMAVVRGVDVMPVLLIILFIV